MILSDVDISKLRQLKAAAQKASQAVDREARKARARGATWTELGYALGISAQAAQKRYGTGPEREDLYRENTARRVIKAREKRATGASG